MHSVLAARHNGNNAAKERCGKNETRTEDVDVKIKM